MSDGRADSSRDAAVLDRARADALETMVLQDDLDMFGGAVPPLHQTSLFTFSSFSRMLATVSGERDGFVYTRGRNPTVAAFEDKVARLEGAEAACAFASGMAAIAAAIVGNTSMGDRIVCVRNVYPDAYRLMSKLLPRLGVKTDFVDGTDAGSVREALAGGDGKRPAKILYLESPTTLLFELQDIELLADAAREVGAVTIADNSWATPLGQRPLEHGADLVVHSASKYLSGHSDVVAGVVAGSRDSVRLLRESELMLLGGKLSPFDAWLLLRGLRTLSIRLDRHRRSADRIATFLSGHELVARVHYPGLDTRQEALFARYFRGSSGLLSFEVAHESLVEPFVDALRLFRLGVSWGGFESLVYPALMSHLAGGPDGATQAFEVPRALVRLHVGLEDAADLERDLGHALDVASKGGRPLDR